MARRRKAGYCKLTGKPGLYVDSHIVPLALTKLNSTGEKVVESELGASPKLRFQGWYDNELVIREGEDVLSRLDSQGIDYLRSRNLLLSSLPTDIGSIPDVVMEPSGYGLRIIHDDALPLRKMLQSIAWRSAVTTRREFSDITIAPEHIRGLAQAFQGNFDDPLNYPTQLFQIVTPGAPHNRSPLLESKQILDENENAIGEAQYIRIYFDGFVGYVHLGNFDYVPDYLKTSFSGFMGKTMVFLHKFEASRTFENIRQIFDDYNSKVQT